VDILAMLGIGYVLRRWRRREPGPKPAGTPNAVPVSAHIEPTSTAPAARPRYTLLLRAARGLLLAGLLVFLAVIPWPTAWATSAALAPTVQSWRLAIVHHIDVITVSLVCFATIEPPLRRLFSAITHIPRLLGLLAQLVWVQLRIGYWRYRNWRRFPVAV
jgi:hypothetical protein